MLTLNSPTVLTIQFYIRDPFGSFVNTTLLALTPLLARPDPPPLLLYLQELMLSAHEAKEGGLDGIRVQVTLLAHADADFTWSYLAR